MSVAPPDVVWQRARHEHARLVLERVLAACRDGGVDVLPVKGILTAHLLYADPGQRPIQDVDLRVRPEDLHRVLDIGQRNGWRLVSRSRAYGTLGFEVLGFLVEFESHVGPPGLCALSIEDMFERARECVAPFGFSHLQPEIHDHVLLACVNVFKDKLIDALPWATKDLEIVIRFPGFLPHRLVALAKRSNTETILWIVATWLADTGSARAWSEIRAQLGRAAPRARYVRLFNRAVHASRPPRGALRVLARAGADRRHQRVLALCAMGLGAIEAVMRRTRTSNVRGDRRNEPAAVPSGTRVISDR